MACPWDSHRLKTLPAWAFSLGGRTKSVMRVLAWCVVIHKRLPERRHPSRELPGVIGVPFGIPYDKRGEMNSQMRPPGGLWTPLL